MKKRGREGERAKKERAKREDEEREGEEIGTKKE
jgi:hypothetical protein